MEDVVGHLDERRGTPAPSAQARRRPGWSAPFRSELTRRRRRALQQLAALEAEADDQRRALDRSDHLDGSTASGLHDIEWASDLARRTATTLTTIDEALWRIELGEYGSCQTCGTDIPSERLRARPHARECVPCTAPSDR